MLVRMKPNVYVTPIDTTKITEGPLSDLYVFIEVDMYMDMVYATQHWHKHRMYGYGMFMRIVLLVVIENIADKYHTNTIEGKEVKEESL